MSKKTVCTFLSILFCLSFSYAQATNQQWEYLEVSQIQSYYDSNTESSTPYRDYNFFNEGIVVRGATSLDWLGKSGWELVGAIPTGENNIATKLVFKRFYNKSNTTREIKELEKTLKPASAKPTDDLIDLDILEAKEKLESFKKADEERLKNVLSKLNNSTTRIINIKSSAYFPNQTVLSAEIVVDATSVLLKDGNKYRSSEAKNYLKEIAKKVSALPDFSEISLLSNAGKFQVGKFSFTKEGITIGISIVVNYEGSEIAVAQGYVVEKWK